MTLLEKAILATISYYDILNYPLTTIEIWRFLIRPKNQANFQADFLEIEQALSEKGELGNYLSSQNGFFFLKGRQDLVKEKISKHKLSQEKWKKTIFIARILQAVPFVRMVAGSGSLALGNASSQSDLDLLIVARHGRIWTARLFVTFLVKLLGKKRDRLGKVTKDKICLNHYLSLKSLEVPCRSLYTAYEYIHLVPLFGKKYFQKFRQKNKPWIKNYLVNFIEGEKLNRRLLKKNFLLKKTAKIFEICLGGRIGDFLEKKFAFYQTRRIKQDYRFAQKGGRIVIKDSQLEFHPNSPEKKILEQFNQKAEEMGLLEFSGQKDSGLG